MDSIDLHKKLDGYARYASWLGGAIILLIAVAIAVTTLMRKFTAASTGNITEIVGYLFAVAVALGFSFVFIRRQNIRIDSAYNLMPRKVKAALDTLAALLFFVFAAYLAYSALVTLARSWSDDSRSVTSLATPLWIPQSIWALGLLLLLLVSGLVAWIAVRSLLSGRWDLVGRVAGMPLLGDEVREFTGQADPAGPAAHESPEPGAKR